MRQTLYDFVFLKVSKGNEVKIIDHTLKCWFDYETLFMVDFVKASQRRVIKTNIHEILT